MERFVSYDQGELVELGRRLRPSYVGADPFPHIVLDDFFDEGFLDRVVEEFPSLAECGGASGIDPDREIKLASFGEAALRENAIHLIRYLNSEPFLQFLEALTGIEGLIPDPSLVGGGYHEISPGGFLKIHADFNKHPRTGLDRRLNLLVYLNRDWDESYGGHLELWDRKMERAVVRALPVFNRCVLFSTSWFSYHGHPDPLTCPEGRSRRSIALYYYSNGRPRSEIRWGWETHGTLFQTRPGSSDTPLGPGSLRRYLGRLVPAPVKARLRSLLSPPRQ